MVSIEGEITEYLTDDGLDLFDSYKFLKKYNIFPNDGGAFHQDSRFLHCIKWCDMISFKMSEVKTKKEKATDDILAKIKGLSKGS